MTYRIFIRLVSNKLTHSHFVPSRMCPKILVDFLVGTAYSSAKMVGAKRTGRHSAGIHVPFTNCFVCRWFCVVHDPKPPLHSHNSLSFGKFQDTERFLIHCERHFSSRLPRSGGTWKYAKAPSTKKTWRDSLPIDMLLSAVSVLVVAQSSSEIPEGLMNNPVHLAISGRLWQAIAVLDATKRNTRTATPRIELGSFIPHVTLVAKCRGCLIPFK